MAAYRARDYGRAVSELDAYLKAVRVQRYREREAWLALGLSYYMRREVRSSDTSTRKNQRPSACPIPELTWPFGLSQSAEERGRARLAFARLYDFGARKWRRHE